jgi:D-aspartate ligase
LTVSDTTTPVVVLNAYNHVAITVIRSLGRLGIPIYAVHETGKAPSLRSKYCRGAFELSITDAPRDAAVESLLGIAARVGGEPLLIPTEDTSCLFVDDNSDVLRQAYRFPEQPHGLVRSLSSKREMNELCKKLKVPTPEASFVDSRSGVMEFGKTATFPLMVKPVDNREFQDFPGAGKAIVADPAELVTVFDRLSRNGAQRPELVLQEYIPGGAESVWMFNGYFDRDSTCLFGVTGKKLRQYPPYVGQTSLGVCEPNPTVSETTQRFMKAVGYRGILDIGYRYDSRDGKYKLLDVNPRIGAAFRLFSAEPDLDVARVLYLDMTGQTVPAAGATRRGTWCVENYDLVASWRYYRDGSLSSREWIASLRDIEEGAWLAADDPYPFGAMGVASAAYALRQARSRPWWTSWRSKVPKPPARSG